MKRIFTSLCIVAVLFLSGRSLAQVTVTSSDSLSCTDTCTTLTAHLEGDLPTDAGVTSDDVYSILHPIGFTFNYYGINYTQVILGANGTLDFTASDATMTDNWSILGPLLGNPYKYNNICGPWCDIDIFFTGSPVGTETYSTDGVAPFRKFVVTWCACSMFSCGTQHTTTQIIIYETTNIIEVHIAAKPVCATWNGGYAIVGVQNATGTAATTAPGRDYPSVWTIPPTEAWRFTPVGGGASYTVSSIAYAPVPYATSSIYWYNASTGAYLGTGPTLHVCPTTTTTYKAGALGCADTSFGYYTVTPGGLITITTSFSNPTRCGICDGSIAINGLTPGSIDTITYTLSGVPQPTVIATVSVGGSIFLTGLCPGTYSDIIAHQGPCSSSPAGPIVLTYPPISISGVASTNPSACGVCDGTITISGLYPGHSFTVTYNKDGIPQTAVSTASSSTGTITLTGLCGAAPPYAGTVYDNIVASFGVCVTPPAGPVTLAAPAPPPATLTAHTNASQCGVCDGTITIKGVPPFSLDSVFYLFNGSPAPAFVTIAHADSTISILSLCAGNYTTFSIKVGECTYNVIGGATITQPSITSLFTQTVHYGCSADTMFYQNLSTTPGPLYYIWHFGDGTTDTSTNPSHVFAQGVYTVTLVATNLHCVDSFKMTDSLIHPLVAAFTDDPNIICQGSAIQFTNKTDSLSTPPLSYIWYFGDKNSSNLISPSHVYPNTGTYKVQLIASNFVPCFDTATAIVYVDSISPINISVTDSVLCRSTFVTFTGTYTTIGNTGVTWNFGDGDSLFNVNPVSHSYDGFGTDTVTITAHYRACANTTTTRIIHVFLAPDLYLGPDTAICAGSESITLRDDINTKYPGTKWKWSTGQTTPAIVVTQPGYYSLLVSLNGCVASDTVWVKDDCYMNIPNVFSPNGDGSNDYFFPRQYLTKGLISFKMSIYNRWGQEIFETKSLDGSGWDGKMNNADQPEGVYVYLIDAVFKDGQKEHHQGNVTLLR